jgi:hypothetical protein
MPKLIVLVEKDDTGKLWNYIFTEDEWAHSHNSFRGAPQLIHKSDSPERTLEYTHPTEPAEKETLTLRLLTPDEEPKTTTRTQNKSNSS